MFIFEKKSNLVEFVNKQKLDGKTIGFVPTMGALHAGHIALMQAAVNECDVSIASIFVNPIQFNNPDDLKKYPRTFESDSKMLEDAGCTAIFYPSVEEMYPDNKLEEFDFGTLATVMEGYFRPGHFNGVAVIVKRLFEIVQPDKAYFGKKDFQQLAIIRVLIKKMNSPVQIIGYDTVREKDGLAMSSRNMRLNKTEREIAVEIFQSLNFIKANKNNFSPAELESKAKQQLAKHFHVEYIQIVDGHTLQTITDWNQTNYPVVCTAAFLGEVRLIDNLEL